jgi:hypothetical protein
LAAQLFLTEKPHPPNVKLHSDTQVILSYLSGVWGSLWGVLLVRVYGGVKDSKYRSTATCSSLCKISFLLNEKHVCVTPTPGGSSRYTKARNVSFPALFACVD